jgi:hypothetical protein
MVNARLPGCAFAWRLKTDHVIGNIPRRSGSSNEHLEVKEWID